MGEHHGTDDDMFMYNYDKVCWCVYNYSGTGPTVSLGDKSLFFFISKCQVPPVELIVPVIQICAKTLDIPCIIIIIIRMCSFCRIG